MTLPGKRLIALSARAFDPATVQSLVEPTIADLQHEVSEAGNNPWRVAGAYLRGYAAVVRLLFASSLFWRSPMRRLSTVLALGWVGATLFYLLVFHGANGPSRLTPFLLMAITTPVVLRQMNLATTFRSAFANCFAVGLIMASVLYALETRHVSATSSSPLPWYALMLTYGFLVACVTVGSAVAAAAAVRTPTNDKGLLWALRHVGASCVAYAVFDGALRLWFGSPIANAVGWASFLALYFGCVALLVHVPILLGARRLVQQRSMLALFGALLCPIPLLTFPVLQGRFGSLWALWSKTPSSAIWSALPYLFAGAVLGWMIAHQARRARSAIA